MALPIPDRIRKTISQCPEGAIAENKDERAKVNTPYKKIFFLPCMSAIRPKGTKNMAADRRYAVATQPNKTASIANSLPMEGSAMLVEEPMKGTTNEVNVATSNAALLVAVSSIDSLHVRFLGTIIMNPDIDMTE